MRSDNRFNRMLVTHLVQITTQKTNRLEIETRLLQLGNLISISTFLSYDAYRVTGIGSFPNQTIF